MLRLLILVAALMLPSCATIVSSGPDIVPVASTPSGAKVMRKGTHVGTTPCNLVFRRTEHAPLLVTLELDGYHTQTVTFSRSFNGWFFGNIIFGGIVGVFIDLVSGNCMYLTARQIDVPLVPVDQAERGAFEASRKGANGKYGVFVSDNPERPKEPKWTTFPPVDPK